MSIQNLYDFDETLSVCASTKVQATKTYKIQKGHTGIVKWIHMRQAV